MRGTGATQAVRVQAARLAWACHQAFGRLRPVGMLLSVGMVTEGPGVEAWGPPIEDTPQEDPDDLEGDPHGDRRSA